MTIEGIIRTIMESWPPQLHVEASDADYHVALSEDTRITNASGQLVTPAELSIDQTVRVQGTASSTNRFALIAEEIKIH